MILSHFVLLMFYFAEPSQSMAKIFAFAGSGEPGYSGDNGPAVQARLRDPFDVAVDAAGNVFFSDTNNHCIRKVDAKTGVITTIAGTGKKGFSGDGGPATQATMNEPYGVQVDTAGNVYFVDRLNACVRKVDGQTGVITTIAGVGGKKQATTQAGVATQTPMLEPNGIALDGKGKLYIADVSASLILVVDLAQNTLTPFAGKAGVKKTSGDNGDYRDATFAGARAVAFDRQGHLLVCEREGHCIRKIDLTSGRITRVAGTGKKGYSGDGGAAMEATFNGPKELEVDAEGNIYVVDTENQVIRKIVAATGKIETFAGNGKLGKSGNDGPATVASLGRPHGVAIGPDGSVYIGDTLSHQIRRVK